MTDYDYRTFRMFPEDLLHRRPGSSLKFSQGFSLREGGCFGLLKPNSQKLGIPLPEFFDRQTL